MKRHLALLAIALYAATIAVADTTLEGKTFKDENVEVKLGRAPCISPSMLGMLRRVDPASHEDAKQANVIYQKRVIAACWIRRGSSVFIVDADGDAGPLPAADFAE